MKITTLTTQDETSFAYEHIHYDGDKCFIFEGDDKMIVVHEIDGQWCVETMGEDDAIGVMKIIGNLRRALVYATSLCLE